MDTAGLGQSSLLGGGKFVIVGGAVVVIAFMAKCGGESLLNELFSDVARNKESLV